MRRECKYTQQSEKNRILQSRPKQTTNEIGRTGNRTGAESNDNKNRITKWRGNIGPNTRRQDIMRISTQASFYNQRKKGNGRGCNQMPGEKKDESKMANVERRMECRRDHALWSCRIGKTNTDIPICLCYVVKMDSWFYPVSNWTSGEKERHFAMCKMCVWTLTEACYVVHRYPVLVPCVWWG